MSFTSRTRFALAAGIVGLGTVAGVGVAGAQTTDPYVSPSSVVQPEVLNESAERPAAAPQSAQAAKAESAKAESTLAFTGGDAAGLAALGGVALAAGTAITLTRRRTAAA